MHIIVYINFLNINICIDDAIVALASKLLCKILSLWVQPQSVWMQSDRFEQLKLIVSGLRKSYYKHLLKLFKILDTLEYRKTIC